MENNVIEFQVNEYLSLRLEDDRTNIYIGGKLFRHCKFLLINIQVDKVGFLDELESIDEAAEKLDHSLEPLREKKQIVYTIPPEVEFWGHCSNLQVWYENGYNSRLLHSNLAFPLLRELSRVGDPQAKKIFKEEIAERYNYAIESVREYLRTEDFLLYLSTEEFLGLIQDETEREVIEQLREDYPLFETSERGSSKILLTLDIKNGRVVKLDLRGLKLRYIPNYLRKLTKLEHLNVSFNLLDTFPDWFRVLQNLKILIINDNQFKTLPIEIGELKNLEELYAQSNQLEKLPDVIGNLQSLKILELYENNLEIIPESIGNLINLKTLALYENKIIRLPESITNLRSIENILLSDNQLQDLPDSFNNLKELKGLFLGNNNLKNLPSSIGNLKGLEIISITNNPISSLPKSLYSLPKLRDFYIDNTILREQQILKSRFTSKIIYVHYLKIKDSERKKEDF